MARIQILQLPETIDEIRPFALIIDQAQDLTAAMGADSVWLASFKNDCGARAVLITEATIDVRS